MKKLLAAILILSISLMFLAGCSSGSNDSGNAAQQAQNTQNPELGQEQQKADSNVLQPPAFPGE